MRSLLTTTRKSSHSKEDPAQPKERRTEGTVKGYHEIIERVLTLFIQLRKTAIVGKGLVKTTHLLSHFKAHQEESDSMDPATKSMKRKDTGNAVVAKQPRRVLRVLKEVSSFYLHIGPSEKYGSYLTVLRDDFSGAKYNDFEFLKIYRGRI